MNDSEFSDPLSHQRIQLSHLCNVVGHECASDKSAEIM